MKIYLIRHGETIEIVQKKVMGQLPGRLSRLGKLQAKKLARALKNRKFDAIYSSDLKRAADTAEEIKKFHPHHKIIYSRDLRESHFGVLQGKSRDSAEIIFSKLPGTFMTKKAKGGEAPKDLRKRVKQFINHLFKTHSRDTILIVTHSGIIKTFLSILLKIPMKKAFETFEIKNTKGFLLEIKGKRVKIREFN